MYAYVPEEYWKKHKETDEIIPTQLVGETAEILMDANLKANGIADGSNSYHGMLALLFHYYLQ